MWKFLFPTVGKKDDKNIGEGLIFTGLYEELLSEETPDLAHSLSDNAEKRGPHVHGHIDNSKSYWQHNQGSHGVGLGRIIMAKVCLKGDHKE